MKRKECFNILEGFLETEIELTNTFEHQGMYRAILDFLTSSHIREGKFECNEYLITKLNLGSVIICQDYELYDKQSAPLDAVIIPIPLLLEKIDERAIKIGLKRN